MCKDHLVDVIRRRSLDNRCCEGVLGDAIEMMQHIFQFHVWMKPSAEWNQDVVLDEAGRLHLQMDEHVGLMMQLMFS